MNIPGKIPIKIRPGFWLSAILIGFFSSRTLTGTISWILVVLLSVLVHEFGHALAALFFGRNSRIELVAFGGRTIHDSKVIRPWQEFIVVLSGPLFGVCLAAIAYFAPVKVPFLSILLYVNIFWTALNLLPIGSLDGGRLLQIIMKGIFGIKGVRFALFFGFLFGIAVAIFFFMKGWFLPGSIFLMLAFDSRREYVASKKIKEEDLNPDVQKSFLDAKTDYDNGLFDSAIEKLKKLRLDSQQGAFYHLATENMAIILEKQGRFAEAYEALNSISKELSLQGKSLLHSLAFSQRDYDLVLKIGSEVFQNDQRKDIAIVNAIASGNAGGVSACVGWFTAALNDGFEVDELMQMLKRPDFDSVRNQSQFEKFIESL